MGMQVLSCEGWTLFVVVQSITSTTKNKLNKPKTTSVDTNQCRKISFSKAKEKERERKTMMATNRYNNEQWMDG